MIFVLFGLAQALAQTTNGNGMTIDFFHTIINTESRNEFHTDSSFSAATSHEWRRASNLLETTRRRLQNEPHVANVPLVVCDETGNQSGFQRRTEISKHFSMAVLHPLINNDAVSCFNVHANHDVARSAPEHLKVQPYTRERAKREYEPQRN